MNNLIMTDKKKDKIYEDNDEKQFLKLRVSFSLIVVSLLYWLHLLLGPSNISVFFLVKKNCCNDFETHCFETVTLIRAKYRWQILIINTCNGDRDLVVHESTENVEQPLISKFLENVT